MRFGSVCSGIEAASVAWHPLGWRAAWLAEIEPFPSAVLAQHYPDVPNLGDMAALPGRIAAGEIEAPDVFCGGTPCQAFSVAGLRRSLDDARGNLSLIFCEIANAIDYARHARGQQPAVIFWENVPGVLSTKDNAFGCFLAGLAGEDVPLEPPRGKWTDAGAVLGPKRTVAWRILDAQYFGLAQRRRRVFVVASARDGFDPAAVLFEFDGVRRDSAPSREAGQRATGSLTARAGRNLGQANDDVDGHKLITMAHGQGGAEICFDRGPTLTSNYGKQPDSSDTNAGPMLISMVVPDVAQPIGFNARQTPDHWQEHTGTLDTDGYTIGVLAFHENQRGEITLNDTARSLKGGGGKPGQGYPAIAFSSKDHGADATADLSPTLRAMGHADSHANGGGQMAVAFAQNQLGEVREGDVFNTINTNSNASGRNTPMLAQAMQVRRLTPVECERLQGFPDNYTAIPWRNKPADQCPDGPRYKALGNSWAVPVVRWIGRRINNEIGMTVVGDLV